MQKRTDYRQRLAEKGARALTRITGWRFSPHPELLLGPISVYPYDPNAHMVLIPVAWAMPRGLVSILNETRCTAILVVPSFTMTGNLTWQFMIGRCSQGHLIWYSGLRLFIATDDRIWFVTNPVSCPLEPEALCLERGWLRQGAVPWNSEAEWRSGVRRGDDLLLQMAEQD